MSTKQLLPCYARTGDAAPLCNRGLAARGIPTAVKAHVRCRSCLRRLARGEDDLRHPWLVGPTPKWSKRQMQLDRAKHMRKNGRDRRDLKVAGIL